MRFSKLYVPSKGRSNYGDRKNVTGNVVISGGGSGGGGGADYSKDIETLYQNDEKQVKDIEGLRTDVGKPEDNPDQDGSLYSRVKAVEGHQTGAEEKVEALQRAVLHNSTFYTDASETDPTKVISINENKGALKNLQENYFNSSQANGLTSLPVFIRKSADAHNTIQAHIVDLTEKDKVVSKVKIIFEDDTHKYVYEFDADGYATEISKSVIDIPTEDLQEIKDLRTDLGTRNEGESNAFTLIRENNTNMAANLAKIQALEGRYIVFDITAPEANKVSYSAYNELKKAGAPFSVYVKKDSTLWPAISVSPSENSIFIGFLCVEIEGGIKKDIEYIYRFMSTGAPEPHPVRREVHNNAGGPTPQPVQGKKDKFYNIKLRRTTGEGMPYEIINPDNTPGIFEDNSNICFDGLNSRLDVIIENIDSDIYDHPENYRIVTMFFKRAKRKPLNGHHINYSKRWRIPMFSEAFNSTSPSPESCRLAENETWNPVQGAESNIWGPADKPTLARICGLYPKTSKVVDVSYLPDGTKVEKLVDSEKGPINPTTHTFTTTKNRTMRIGFALYKKDSEQRINPGTGDPYEANIGPYGWSRVSNVASFHLFCTSGNRVMFCGDSE